MALDKLGWDVYFMTMAFAASRRSIDPSTKVGCIIVSKTRRILSTGYNGPIRGADDSIVEAALFTRPDKYYLMIHAEENAVTTYSGSEVDIDGATAYVTCPPCHRCLRMMVQRGIRRIVHTDAVAAKAKMMDEEEMRAQALLLSCRSDVEIGVVPYSEIIRNLDEVWYQIVGSHVRMDGDGS